MRRALLLAVTALLVLPVLAPVTASPAPTSVCPVCGYELEAVAESNDVDLSIAESEATARLHENGTTTWTARVRATNASSFQALDSDPGLRQATEQAFGFGGPETEVRAVRLEGDTLVVRYARSGQVSRTQGVFRYDGLRDDPGVYVYLGLGADRVTVEGPPGTTVVRAPGAAATEEGRVTFTSLPDGQGPFLVFTPGDASVPGVRAVLAVFLPLLPVFARNAFWYIGVPTLAFAGGLSGLRYAVRDRTIDRALVARGVGALAAGLAFVVAVDLALGPRTRVPLSPGPNPAVVGGVVATLLLAGLVARGTTPTPRRAVGFTLGAALAGVVAALAVVSVVPGESVTLGVRGIAQVLLGLPVLLAFPAGVAARTTKWRVTLLGVLFSATLLLALQFDVFQTGDYMFSFGVVLAVLAGLVGTLASFPLFLLGVSTTATPTSG